MVTDQLRKLSIIHVNHTFTAKELESFMNSLRWYTDQFTKTTDDLLKQQILLNLLVNISKKLFVAKQKYRCSFTTEQCLVLHIAFAHLPTAFIDYNVVYPVIEKIDRKVVQL